MRAINGARDLPRLLAAQIKRELEQSWVVWKPGEWLGVVVVAVVVVVVVFHMETWLWWGW